ncbi:oxidoreductase [Bradyrhizobium manausense]|uniref:NAD(P)/FAD-dependent oxidoreductase n=1 Tax=Bradyrhizobium manausense TaxID=989370 RepID=UPI001BA5EAC8|nr:FAD-dependent oxidoreductase [Bradyrhizobium manausense]MBR0828582.1 oxidoreductase [Bradyrhizobium manausense]
MSPGFDCLIVGAGHAGAHAAIFLRQHGFTGSIAIIGDEPELPYERPPLSKDYLSGAKHFERMLLRPAAFWAEINVAMLPGRRAEVVEPSRQILRCTDGSSYGYANLIWAAGGRPRSLDCPGGDLAGVHRIRSRADVDAIGAELPNARDICVVGGGYIGLEAAAVLVKLGKRVTVLEAMDRVLARVAGAELSHFYEREHLAHGVDLRLNSRVRELIGERGHVASVVLDNGGTLPADMVIVGVGIVPNVEALAAAGIACGDGVEVDEFCRTSVPNVYAVGDCARHANAFAPDGGRIRLESVQNASDQANCAARAIVGRPQPYCASPWFWSDQYDLRLQTAGLSTGHDQAIVRGDPTTKMFSVIYLRRGRFQAIDCVNNGKDFVAAKRLVGTQTAVSADRLADPRTPLKEMIPSANGGQPAAQDARARHGDC